MPNENKAVIPPTDYENPDNWMSIPSAAEDKPVDLFYLCYTGAFDPLGEGELWPVDNPKWRLGMQTGLATHYGIFAGPCNVYAPYYRQLSFTDILGKTTAELDSLYAGAPATDAIAAFDTYIKKYNNGRPFVLFGQSQGSGAMRGILLDYMDKHPQVAERMVAAYLIGFFITKDEVGQRPHLRLASGADDTGVIISYNTEAPGDDYPNGSVMDGERSFVINPVNWRTDDTYAAASQNLGTVITGKGTIDIRHSFADAQICPQRGAVVCSTASPEEFGSPIDLGSFHTVDILLYHANLRENVKRRIAAYLAKQK